MFPTTGARSRYLALALASRKLIDSLLLFVETSQQDPQLAAALAQFTRSVEITRAGSNLFAAAPGQPSFSHYEQVLILREAMESLRENDRDVVASLSGVLDEASDIKKRKDSANKAIEFFYALENRALNNYNQQIGAREN